MTPLAWAFDLLLGLGLLWLAWRALACPDLFKAIVLFVAFGLFMALAWVRLAAPDVALAEAAIGAGLTGALLITASSRSWFATIAAPSVCNSADAAARTGNQNDLLHVHLASSRKIRQQIICQRVHALLRISVCWFAANHDPGFAQKYAPLSRRQRADGNRFSRAAMGQAGIRTCSKIGSILHVNQQRVNLARFTAVFRRRVASERSHRAGQQL